jgi:hypothetical protein
VNPASTVTRMVRRASNLFGISDAAALSYCAELEQLTVPRSPGGYLASQSREHTGAVCPSLG